MSFSLVGLLTVERVFATIYFRNYEHRVDVIKVVVAKITIFIVLSMFAYFQIMYEESFGKSL